MKREVKRQLKEKQLQQFRRWKLKIQNDLNNYNLLESEIKNIEYMCLGCQAQNTQGMDMPKAHGDSHSQTEQQALDMMRHKEDIEATKRAIDKAINKASEQIQSYFKMRYVKEFTKVKICRELYVESSTYKRINNKMIIQVGKEMGLIE